MTKLKKEPINIDKHTWYYEENKGICVVREVLDKDGNYIQTEQFYLPWKKLMQSIENKYL